MAERLDLTTPETETLAPTLSRVIPNWVIYGFVFGTGISWDEETGVPIRLPGGSLFDLRVAGLAGAHRTVRVYSEQEAFDTIRALNKADLRANTLEKRGLARLTTLAAKYAGTISGVPD